MTRITNISVKDDVLDRLSNLAKNESKTVGKITKLAIETGLEILELRYKISYYSKKTGLPIKFACCDNKPHYAISYNIADHPNETWLVCDEHFKEDAFNRHVKAIHDVSNLTP